MTKLEKEALILFKEYSMFELKAFQVAEQKRLLGKTGGATEPYELLLLNEALNLHHIYMQTKIDKSKS